ncbi:DUF2284 domain-containing protein [Desulfobulbus elongatus]|uniref:DUF2284 domain-containing protein n=1 Tax=Desulfobulbus elongatus TaxID=53332 RepID=UPI0009FF4C32|nr:DUF2284 domain-containing protein [Desulfobulbus elongatus]
MQRRPSMQQQQQGRAERSEAQRSAGRLAECGPQAASLAPDRFLALAQDLGATAAVLLPADVLVINDRYAALCAAPHRCPSYGLTPGCPPHAPSPAAFRACLAGYRLVLVFKIDAPAADLLSDNRKSVAQAIHRIAAGLEQAARSSGFARARGMAAGSCRELFCADEADCAVLHGARPCRHPDLARPSISAVGIDFAALAAQAGWPFARIDADAAVGSEPAMGLMAGLVLLD